MSVSSRSTRNEGLPSSSDGHESDQVRKLLFGEPQCVNEQRMAAADARPLMLQKAVAEDLLQSSAQVARLGEERAATSCG
jgi:hypothetical protein